MTEIRIWCDGEVKEGGTMQVTLAGNYNDLAKMITVAMDAKEVRALLKEAVLIDMIHDDLVGRHESFDFNESRLIEKKHEH